MSRQILDLSSRIPTLLSWFTEGGGWVSPDVEVVYNHSHGFHMLAKRPLRSALLLSCPLRLTLSILNLESDGTHVLPIDSTLQPCRGKIPHHILAPLLLIEQRNRGPASPWHPYIACLPGPESMTTPLWFSDEDAAFLAGTSLAPAALERKRDLYKQWDNVVAVFNELEIPLATLTVQLTPGLTKLLTPISDSLFWAATIFTSRAFTSTHILPGQETVPVLFPVVDILNHSPTARVEWNFQPRHSFALQCQAGETVTAGQELFNNYAPKQNDELLLGYGFCLEENPVEQFALKLAFPPMLLQQAQDMGLLDVASVPFGMTPDFLDKHLASEQDFLRTRDHPFGRYANHMPYFRGIPPRIVHYFFIQAVMTSGLDVAAIHVERPEPRITLQVLLLLHQAISQRSRSLPLEIPLTPTNAKQTFAKIYRDGQAKIIHSIRDELQTAIDALQTPSPPTLLSIPNALASLETSFPNTASTLQQGLQKHNLHPPQHAHLIWPLLLIATAASWLSTPASHHPVPPAWFPPILSTPLPALEDGIEDAETYTFIDDHLDHFLTLPGHGVAPSAMETLDRIGLAGGVQGAGRGFIAGPTRDLGARLVMWGMAVGERHGLGGGGEWLFVG